MVLNQRVRPTAGGEDLYEGPFERRSERNESCSHATERRMVDQTGSASIDSSPAHASSILRAHLHVEQFDLAMKMTTLNLQILRRSRNVPVMFT